MDAKEYKKQFIAFLKTSFPDGLPSGNKLRFAAGENSFVFRFDEEDYYDPSTDKKVKQPTISPKKSFSSLLTDQDKAFLKRNRISLHVKRPKSR